MSKPRDEIEERLTRLGRETEAIRARPGFSARVMQAVALDPGASFFEELTRASRRLLPVALLVAAVGVIWAFESDRSVDDALATSDDPIELEW